MWDLMRSVSHRHDPMVCGNCGGVGKKVMTAPTVRTFEPYYDEGLHSDVYSERDRRSIMKQRGVHEIGDTVRGARNFDPKAPNLVGKQPPRGVRPKVTKNRDFPVETVDSSGRTVDKKMWSELPTAG